MSALPGWQHLPRSIRHRLSRRRPFWIHEHIISPYADRLMQRAVGQDVCFFMGVRFPREES